MRKLSTNSYEELEIQLNEDKKKKHYLFFTSDTWGEICTLHKERNKSLVQAYERARLRVNIHIYIYV